MTATFSMLDHLDKLDLAGKEKDRFICPVCGGSDLTIQLTGAHAGAYQCWSGQCKSEDIRQAVSPLRNLKQLNPRQVNLAQYNKAHKQQAYVAAEIKAECEQLAYMVVENCHTKSEALLKASVWAKSEGHDVYAVKQVLQGILGGLGVTEGTDESELNPEDLKAAIQSWIDEDDPFRRALLERQIGRDYGVRGKTLDWLGRVAIAPSDGGTSAVDDVVNEVFCEIEERSQSGIAPGVRTGFIDLDSITGGFQNSDLIVMAGRPAMGKTGLAMGCAMGAASHGVRSLVFSLEMSRKQLTYRMLSCYSSVDVSRLRAGKIGEHEWDSLGIATGAISSMPITINDTPELTVSEIDRVASADKPGLIIIDYCTLLDGPGNDARSVVTYNTKMLKILARKLNVPIVLLSQLSRGVETRKDKRPLMADLRESGSVEQDADLIMMVYREEYYNPETVDKGVAEVIIAKHRNGPTGTVKLLFEPQYTRFRNLAPTIG